MSVFDRQHEFVDNIGIEASEYRLGSGEFLHDRFFKLYFS